MPPLNVSTDFTDNGTTPGWGAHHVLPTGQGRRYSVGGIILSLLVLPLLAASLAAAHDVWLLRTGAGPRALVSAWNPQLWRDYVRGTPPNSLDH